MFLQSAGYSLCACIFSNITSNHVNASAGRHLPAAISTLLLPCGASSPPSRLPLMVPSSGHGCCGDQLQCLVSAAVQMCFVCLDTVRTRTAT